MNNMQFLTPFILEQHQPHSSSYLSYSHSSSYPGYHQPCSYSLSPLSPLPYPEYYQQITELELPPLSINPKRVHFDKILHVYLIPRMNRTYNKDIWWSSEELNKFRYNSIAAIRRIQNRYITKTPTYREAFTIYNNES